jgi:MYXO-CTERM domain-containing protein
MLIKRLIGMGTVMVLLGAGSVALAQDGGTLTPDAVAAPDVSTGPDASTPPPNGMGYQDCNTDADCAGLAPNKNVVIKCVPYTDPTSGQTFNFCKVDVNASSNKVQDNEPPGPPSVGNMDNANKPCQDDSDCDDGENGYPVGTFLQCDPSFLRCRPIDQGAIACQDGSDCPRGEDCKSNFCDNRATDEQTATTSEVPCGRSDNCGKARGVGCAVEPSGSPLASTGLALLAAVGLLLIARRTRRS